MPRILHIINTLAPSGAETLLMNLAANFRDPDYNIYIAYILGEGDLLQEYRLEENIQIVNLTRNGRFSFFVFFKLLRIIRQERIDLVHTHLVHAGILGKLAARLCGIKCVSTRHYGFHHNENKLWYKIEDFLTRSASAVIAISDAVKQDLVARNIVPENKIFVIPNAIDFNRLPLANTAAEQQHNEGRFIGSVGRLDPQKDFSTLLQSMRLVSKRLSHVRLEIIGDGPLRPHLERQMQEAGLAQQVRFTGKLPNSEVLRRMAGWDLFVLSSAWEGFGIALIEAMALAKAVVATSVEGVLEVVDDGSTGYLVPPRTPELLAERIIELLSDDEKRRAMGRRGREKAQTQFSIEKYIAHTKKIYDALLKPQASAMRKSVEQVV